MIISIAAVRYFWPQWYVRETWSDGRIAHWGPWNSKTAADYLVVTLTSRYKYEGKME